LLHRGYQAGADRARRVTDEDFERYGLILAMDKGNLADLQSRCPEAHRHKVKLFLDFAPETGQSEVPDPYYGDARGFERVLDLCEAGAIGLINSLRKSSTGG
jgi:protein-tyrosine phosphatase